MDSQFIDASVRDDDVMIQDKIVFEENKSRSSIIKYLPALKPYKVKVKNS